MVEGGAARGRQHVRTRPETARRSGPPATARVPVEPGRPVLVPAGPWSRLRAWLVLDAFERSRHTVHLVAGERFDPYRVVRAARRAGHRPRNVLSTSRVARAFTAAQLASLVHDRLEPHLHGAHALTVCDPLDMLVTDEVTHEQARVLLSDMLDVLGSAGRDTPVLVTQRRLDTPLLDPLGEAVAAARVGRDGVSMPNGGIAWWGPTRQTTLDAYPPAGVEA